MSTSSPEAVKKLLENMQTDLRSLSMECKKKFPPVKEVSRLVSFTEPYPWRSAGCLVCESECNFHRCVRMCLFEPVPPSNHQGLQSVGDVDTELSSHCTGKLKVVSARGPFQ